MKEIIVVQKRAEGKIAIYVFRIASTHLAKDPAIARHEAPVDSSENQESTGG